MPTGRYFISRNAFFRLLLFLVSFIRTCLPTNDSGAIWYPRKMNVGEGFDARFEFEISLPSTKCNRMDDVSTFCRSRGADGIAFVLQNTSDSALGNAGSGLGYDGIFNALAVEIDTFFNFDRLDSYENHIAVIKPCYPDLMRR